MVELEDMSMTRRQLVRSVLVPLVLAVGFAGAAADAQAKGRYKKEDGKCVWDANDSGPNQCEPRVRGRFKKSGSSCTWDVNALGPDQCRPAKGRFKKEEGRCVWSTSDSGPDQCDPREPR
jgi:hypothetical protein